MSESTRFETSPQSGEGTPADTKRVPAQPEYLQLTGEPVRKRDLEGHEYTESVLGYDPSSQADRLRGVNRFHRFDPTIGREGMTEVWDVTTADLARGAERGETWYTVRSGGLSRQIVERDGRFYADDARRDVTDQFTPLVVERRYRDAEVQKKYEGRRN